jgi:DHA2 family multidrug resistance protein
MMLATAMQAADATIVNVALPQLERDLHGGIELGAWIMTGYLCAAAVVVPLTGWLSRTLGPRRLYRGAIGLFVVASLLCATASSETGIILFRILQGAGGGVIPALTQAALHDLHPKERHGRVLAVWGAVAMLGPILGPALSGTITDLASWRWVFLINIPLGIAATWRVGRVLPRAVEGVPPRFDVAGLLMLIAGVGALQLCLERSARQSLASPELLAEASIAIIALTLLAVRASRSGLAILRLDVFRDINFAVAAFLNFMTSALLFTAIVFLPTLVQGPLGHSATIAGLTIVPRGVLMMLVVLAAGRIIERMDYRLMLAIGAGLMTIGPAVIGPAVVAAIGPATGLGWIILGSTIQAIGAGMILMPLSTFAFVTLPPERRTDAAGLYGLLRQIGCASGVALMSAVLQARIATHLAQAAYVRATLLAYADCFTALAIAALVMIPAVLLLRLRGGRIPEAPLA